MIKILSFKDRRALSKIIKIAASENMFITKKKTKFIGYFESNKLIGLVGFYVLPKQYMIGFVSGYVLPTHRNKGIYHQLSQYRLQYVKDHYIKYSIYLTANNNSKHEMKKLGFIIIEPQYRMKLDI